MMGMDQNKRTTIRPQMLCCSLYMFLQLCCPYQTYLFLRMFIEFSNTVLNVRNESLESPGILSISRKLYLDVYMCNSLLYSLAIYNYYKFLLC